MTKAITDPVGIIPNGSRESPPLALRPKDAAHALGISERLLWSMTNRRQVPHVRLGKAVLYPVAELERWLAQQAAESTRPR